VINTNTWNRIRYTAWAPLYDLVGRRFDRQRRESIQMLHLLPGERTLIVGGGTGADRPHIPDGVMVVVTDLTAAMLARARRRRGAPAHFAIMDGHRLAVRDGAFDAVVLHLILAVLPDPVRCLQEVARVLRPGGRVAVFDKFVRGDPNLGLRVLNVVTSTLFTDVTRSLEDILERAAAPLAIEQDSPALLRGLFRRILLRRTDQQGEPA
jgi:ubiquinone/menaquinone biosynthesis C-methylase UbiE